MRSLCWAVLWTAVSLPLAAQTSVSDDARIDAILAGSSLTWGDAAWLVGRSTGAFDEGVTPEQAAVQAVAAGWAQGPRPDTEEVDLQTYSYLVVRALDIPTGVLYSWFPSPRYALRELVYNRVLPSLPPDGRVSGEDALRYLQAAQDWKESRL